MYIKLEDVQNIVEKYSYAVVIDLGLKKEINSLPTINPSKIIEDMIEEYKKLESKSNDEGDRGAIYALEQALFRINQ